MVVSASLIRSTSWIQYSSELMLISFESLIEYSSIGRIGKQLQVCCSSLKRGSNTPYIQSRRIGKYHPQQFNYKSSISWKDSNSCLSLEFIHTHFRPEFNLKNRIDTIPRWKSVRLLTPEIAAENHVVHPSNDQNVGIRSNWWYHGW